MAGKSRRVASRQGELSRRRKRGQRGPSGVPATQAGTQAQQNGAAAAVAVGTEDSVPAQTASATPESATQAVAPAAERPAPQAATQTRSQPRTRGERPAAYNYVGAELRRIGILSTVVVAALIAIAVVL